MKDVFEEYFGERILTKEQYLEEKKALEDLKSIDFNTNPKTELDIRLEINALQFRTKEYEDRHSIDNVIEDLK